VKIGFGREFWELMTPAILLPAELAGLQTGERSYRHSAGTRAHRKWKARRRAGRATR